MLKTNLWDVKTDHPALYTLYTRVYRIRSWWMCKGTLWLSLSQLDTRRWLLPQWGGDEIPRGIPSP